jgi:hypothetical protein
MARILAARAPCRARTRQSDLAARQRCERRIGAGLFETRRATLPFNGYAEQVAGLYRGMDLRKFF